MHSSIFDKVSAFIAEIIGTAMLVFFGCMGCINYPGYENNILQMTFNFGLVVLVIVQCFGIVSGSHINPAVTVAAVIYQLISIPMGFVYFLAQLIGSCLGYGLLKAVVPQSAIKGPDAAHGLCVTMPRYDINGFQATVIEFFLTSMLVYVCCAVWDPRNAKNTDSTSIRFGLTISCLGITAGQFTGASMNPVRSFAPALWNLDFESHWIYWVGPLLAAFVCPFLYKYVFRRELKDNDDE